MSQVDGNQLRKMVLLMLSTDSDGEALTAISMVKATLKRGGEDIHWLASRLTSSAGAGNNGGGNGADRDAIIRASRAGYEKGRAEGYAQGYAKANGGRDDGWSPDFAADPAQAWAGPEPTRASKMPPQRWAAWVLARHRPRLSEWEKGFCESVARWEGPPTEKQKSKLESIILRVLA